MRPVTLTPEVDNPGMKLDVQKARRPLLISSLTVTVFKLAAVEFDKWVRDVVSCINGGLLVESSIWQPMQTQWPQWLVFHTQPVTLKEGH